MSDPVRLTALEVLRAVDERDAYVNLLLPTLLRERGITGRDAALATELTHGTLRRRGSYDAVIGHVAAGREIDPPVLDALRLGTHQLLAMRIPSHAAVSTTVDLVRRAVGHRPVGFANAVLRRISGADLDAWMDSVTEGLENDEAQSIRSSHPLWILRAFRDALGPDGDLPALLEADNTPPRVMLVARPGMVDPDELPGTPGRHSPFARVLDSGDPGEILAVQDGRAGVQDEGSQLVAIALADASIAGSDQRWLDLCAGPGGKATLLGAIAAQRGARLVANELQAHRADLVRASVAGLENVEVTEHDGRDGPWADATFDRVLVDAPCTGLGALRRRPEARWRRSPDDLDTLVPLQHDLLARALDLVRPGGVVVYATCSPHLAETREVVDAVTGTRDDVSVESVRQLWPHVDGTDAMFWAVLRRR